MIDDGYIKLVPTDDIVYVRFRQGDIAKTLERGDNILIDMDSDGKPLGLEVVGISTTPVEEILAVLAELGLKATRQEKQLLALAAA